MHTDVDRGITYQVGIISWGDSCGKNPGVYTNLESPVIMNFINQIMCQNLIPERCFNGFFYGPNSNKTYITIDKENETNNGNESTGTVSASGSASDSTTFVPTTVKTSGMGMNNTKIDNNEIKVNETKVTETQNVTNKVNETKVTDSSQVTSKINTTAVPESQNNIKVNATKLPDNTTNNGETNKTMNDSESQTNVKVDLCKNSDDAYCEAIKNMPFFGCKFSKNKCPEICCKNLCDPDKGCIDS